MVESVLNIEHPLVGSRQLSSEEQAELDRQSYQLDDGEVQFMSSQTGISSPEELREHVLQIRKEAYAVSGT